MQCNTIYPKYYISVFYASPACLNGHNNFKDVRKLNALHFRSLRVACKDYSKKLSRAQLDQMGRARPTTWACFQTASIIMKAVLRERPKRLHDVIKQNVPT